MITGTFRDGHPRALLEVKGARSSLEVEFVVDTGFEGDLVIPDQVAARLGGAPDGFVERMLADGSRLRCLYYLVEVQMEGGPQMVEALVMGQNGLLGTVFLQEQLLQVEMTEGGMVSAEPL